MARTDQRVRRGKRSGSIVALFIVGVALLAAGSFLTRVHLQPWCEYWYGLVWLGFVLTSEAVLARSTGQSLFFDRPRELAMMFAFSAGLWWLFEVGNHWFFDSWSYAPSPEVPLWLQRLRSTLFFSTLLPATWEALMLGALVFRVRAPPPRAVVALRHAWIEIGVGGALGLLALSGALQALGPLRLPVALSVAILLLDGSNALRARPSLLQRLVSRDARFFAALVFVNLALGLLSEMWNHQATPKWSYSAPYAGSLRLFEMPLVGYLGYVVLAMLLFAAYHAVRRPRGRGSSMAEHPIAATGLG